MVHQRFHVRAVGHVGKFVAFGNNDPMIFALQLPQLLGCLACDFDFVHGFYYRLFIGFINIKPITESGRVVLSAGACQPGVRALPSGTTGGEAGGQQVAAGWCLPVQHFAGAATKATKGVRDI